MFKHKIIVMKSIIYSTILFVSLFLFSCNTPEAPEFQKLENVKFKSASFSKDLNFTLSADALFHNSNTLGADITGLDLEVFVNDKKVSDIKQNVTASMGGNSDFKLPIELVVPLREVLKDVKPSLGELFKKREVNYHLKGTASVSVAGVEVDVPVDYEGKEELKL